RNGQPGRPTPSPHRQIGYLQEPVGSAVTRSAKPDIDSDPHMRSTKPIADMARGPGTWCPRQAQDRRGAAPPASSTPLMPRARPVRRVLDDDAGEFDPRGDAELAECLTEVVGDGVGADVHAGGDLVVVQSLGDQGGDRLLGLSQAVPSGDGPG